MSKKPRILLYDLETSPNLAYSFGGKWEVNLAAVKDYSQVLSFAYKWSDSKEVICVSQQEVSEKKLLKELVSLLNEADISIAHNGDSFDNKVTKTRMLKHGMDPLKILTTIDTRKVARKEFKFMSNSLDDLADYLEVGRKLKHTGIEMWLGCMAGNKGSWSLMKKYNKHDVFPLLDGVYKKLRPWISNHPNIAKIKSPTERRLCVCPSCGSSNTQKRGFKFTNKNIQQQWVCSSCKHPFVTRFVDVVETSDED